MGRKRTRTGKLFFLLAAGLILLSLGCLPFSQRTSEVRERPLTVKASPRPAEAPPVVSKPLPAPEKSLTPPRPAEEAPPAVSKPSPAPEKSPAPPLEDPVEKRTKKESRPAPEDPLLRAKNLFVQGNYEAALQENQRVLALSPKSSPGDEALLNIGLLTIRVGNSPKDLDQALAHFQKLIRDFPQSSAAARAKVLVEVLQENRKLHEAIEKTKAVDLAIEEKKREKEK